MANENWRPMEGESLHHMPNEGEEMVLPWPQIVFATITFITLPVYILILIAICRHQKLSTFYVLMLSQGVADILALLSYFFLATLRVSGWFVEFYWNNQAILANAQFVFIYFTAYIRCVGITLISLQRYATVCLNGNSRGKIISEIPSPLYVMVHWTTAILLISPICTTFHSYYNSPNTLDIVNPPEMLALASLMMFVAVVVFFSISMVCYAQVFFHILHYNYFTNNVNSQELRLCIQATGLLVAFVLLFFYHVGQFVINHINDLQLLFTWRLFHPLVTGFVSWVQPWMCLAFNSDVREHVLKILFCRREQLPTHTGTMRNLFSLLLVVVCVATVVGQFYGGRGPYGGGPYGGGFGRGPYGGGFGRSPYGYGGNPYGGGFGRVNPLQGAMMGAMMGAMRG